ncbi:MAG TPA: aldehyde-activating protein [Oceanospirillaceae bacterium]|nr:aldehyde-activating protein [Oceanospirillaceae bacterium]
MTKSATGSCLCGAVKYQVTGPLRPVVACHCGQCQKASGHHVAATSAQRQDFELLEEQGLKWFSSSQGIRRGFCQQCGGNLFWDKAELPSISIFAGTLDQPSGLELVEHIYVEEKADYYQLTDGLPQRQGFSMTAKVDNGQ